jgi:phosphomannomutase
MLLRKLEGKYKTYRNCTLNTVDGLKIEFKDGNWIHMRKSNTEPIIRIYAESTSIVIADNLISKINQDIYEILNEDRIALSQE